MKTNGYRTALGGLLSAFSVAIMLFGSLLPFATYVVPVVSSVTIVYFCIEYSRKHAISVYIVIAILSLFFVPDKEIAFMFTFVFGPYPMLKSIYELKMKRSLCFFLKVLTFNCEILFTYFLLLKVLVSSVLVTEFMGYSSIVLGGILLLGNITFVIYDVALTRVISLYINRIRPHITKKR